MLSQIPENLEGKLLYRVVQRRSSRDGKISELPTLGYVLDYNSLQALEQLAREYGANAGYIPVLYKND